MREFIMSGLYRHEPVKEWRNPIHHDNLYWCMNWTFRPQKGRDGSLWMVDTYFDKSFKVDEKNEHEWELIFDFNEVKKIPAEEAREYEEDDLFVEGVDSGGMSYPKYFVMKDAKKSKEQVIAILEGEIRYLKGEIALKEERIKELKGYER